MQKIAKIEPNDVIKHVEILRDRANRKISFVIRHDIFIKEVMENCASLDLLTNRKTIVVEYSSPNIAKPFHMGHLQSTIIGNFVSNLYSFLDNKVTRLNYSYLGDWDTQFGFINPLVPDLETIKNDPVRLLYEAYVYANKLVEKDPTVADEARDPTTYGNLKPSEETINAVIEILREGSCNGYAPCVGFEHARDAVATYLSHDGVTVTSQDVILCSGCSSSLEICITALADPSKKHNILIPRPGFPLYRTLAESIGVAVKYYNLIPEQDWEVDLDHLESQIDSNTALILLNNPSNPCGSVYTEDHLRNILEIAYRRRLPVIADEIYERLVFPGKKFISVASLNSQVPTLICGGLAKRFLVPGWRLGWIVVHDETGAFHKEVKKGINNLSQRIIGSNTLIQGALPAILNNTPQSFHDDLIKTLKRHAEIAFEELKCAKGLMPYMPEGTMYMMIEMQLDKFPMFTDGLDLVRKLMEEESVFCLPGDCFQLPGFVRIVLTVPEDLLREACGRISEFCNRYYTESA